MNVANRIREIERLLEAAQTADASTLVRLTSDVRTLLTDGSANGNAGLYPALVRYLRVGPIPLPAGVSTGLAERAASFADRWLSRATVNDFIRGCHQHTAEVRAKRSLAESLRSEVEQLRDLRETLALYLELLDALEREVDIRSGENPSRSNVSVLGSTSS